MGWQGTMIPGAILAYLVLLSLIGLWSARNSLVSTDFYLAGRRLGLLTTVLATMASIMSGFVFVGGPGLFYSVGLGSFWIVVSASFTGAMMCWLIARPLHRMATETRCLTIPDVILVRYGCRFSSGFAAVGILLGVIGYLATQLLALGVVLAGVLGTSLWVGILAGAFVLVFYTTAGGMAAAVYTDLLQGAVMLVSTSVIFGYAVVAGGGFSGVSTIILEHTPDLLSPWGLVGPIGCLGWFFLFAVGSLGQPHVVHKMMMVRDLRLLKHFPWILAVSMTICSLVWLGVGLSVKSLVLGGTLAPLAHPDEAITSFLHTLAPSWLAALAYAGIVSAIMSTADSFANIGSAVLARDLPRVFGRASEPTVTRSRIFSVVVFVLALTFALSVKGLVAYVGILGFGIFAAALTPLLSVGLNWTAATAWSARASLTVGTGVAVTGEIMSRLGAYTLEIPPTCLALLLSFIAFLGLGLSCRSDGPSRSVRSV
jgi:Na+/proline symporter